MYRKVQKLYFSTIISFIAIIIFLIVGELITRGFFSAPKIGVIKISSDSENSGEEDLNNIYNYGFNSLHYYTLKGYRLTPNLHVNIKNHPISNKDIEIITNSYGFRNDEIQKEKGDYFRILVLGDSITLADYVNDEDTYVRILENKLKNLYNDIQVINAGIASIDLQTQYFLLNEVISSISPDIVLIGLYLNDASGVTPIKPLEYPLNESQFLNLLYRLVLYIPRSYERTIFKQKHSKWIYDFKGGRLLESGDWITNKDAFDFEILKAFGDWGYSWNDKSWKELSIIFKWIKKLKHKYNFELIVSLFPVRYQVEANIIYDTPQQLFSEMSDNLNIKNVDLLPTLRMNYQILNDSFYYDHCHLNPLGNKIVADKMYEYMVRNNLIPIKN